jgi:hypothetical protein
MKSQGESAGYVSVEVEQLILVKLSVSFKFRRQHLMSQAKSVTDTRQSIYQWNGNYFCALNRR